MGGSARLCPLIHEARETSRAAGRHLTWKERATADAFGLARVLTDGSGFAPPCGRVGRVLARGPLLLQRPHLRERAARAQQRFVRAPLDDTAKVHHDDLLRM